ncbi:MAG: M14 family metallopeptidase [Bacteroidales bacterium]|jgi:hypothetical protein|nr:M14 family metallopeptidase [Bacteroidales bacterium]
MKKKYLAFISLSFLLMSIFYVQAQTTSNIVKPIDYFGFQPGSEGNLFTYEQLIDYLKILDKSSPRLKMEQIGESPMGKPMYLLFISSEKNIQNLDKLKVLNREIMLNPNLSPDEQAKLIEDARVFFLATLSMHSSEVGPAQAASLIAYDYATTTDPQMLSYFDDVVYMMVPNHNPDGMNMVVNNYLKYKGTKYEGATLPGLYHKYVGHDNNRDFITLSQSDSRAISTITSTTWFPQVMVEKHQMGSRGPRYFVPPNHDPIAENIDPGLWNWNGLFGTNMIKDLTGAGLKGVSQGYAFDNYWPGSTETCLWKNVMAFLTEAASVDDATSIYIEPNELSVSGKGLAEYEISANMPDPWMGGWWTLNDIIQLELVSTKSIIKTASFHKKEILSYTNNLCKKEIKLGATQAPYYYILPKSQHDQGQLIAFVNLMLEHGIQISQLKEKVIINQTIFEKGSVVVPLSQPFRAFVKEVMENQEFPVRHYSKDGPMIKPYDITSWSLPLHMGLKSFEINDKVADLGNKLGLITEKITISGELEADADYVILPVAQNKSFAVAFELMSEGQTVYRLTNDFESAKQGSFAVKLSAKNKHLIQDNLKDNAVFAEFSKEKIEGLVKLNNPKIGFIETWNHDMDAGWTRYVLDSHHIPFQLIRPDELKTLDLSAFDVLVFPSSSKDILLEGKRKGSSGEYNPSSLPPEYAKGMGKEGLKRVMEFVQNGGNVVSWGNSTDMFMSPMKISIEKEDEEFSLPISNISSQLKKKGLYVAGSLATVNVKPNHPLTYGLEETANIFYRGNPVFQTSMPGFDSDRRVVATFPKDNICPSGYMENEGLLAKLPAAVWIKKGEGQMAFFAFSPQFRSSTSGVYKFLFNALLMD